MSPLAQEILISIVSTVTLSLLTLLFASVRSALFFKAVEYDFTYKRGTGPCEWDIQWEGFRLTIAAEKVSNDYLEKVIFRRNKRKDTPPEALEPSDSFVPLFKNEIQVKLNSIIRKEQGNDAEYILRFVFRRRRKLLRLFSSAA
jgi:hypothetical protein